MGSVLLQIILMNLLFSFASMAVMYSGDIPSSTLSSQTLIFLNNNSDEYVELFLRNKSLKAISLLVPGVINPILSPLSRSGVSLKAGQKILFRYKDNNKILLVVSSDLAGKSIDVAKLLKEAKEDLDKDHP